MSSSNSTLDTGWAWEDKHVHHWVIETPAGPTVLGVCKKCNEQRVFPTSFEPEDEPGAKHITWWNNRKKTRPISPRKIENVFE